MRFGWFAAAALLACAGQASAARYYEFEIVGSEPVTFYDPYGLNPPVSFIRHSDLTASFDSNLTLSPSGYLAFGVPELITAFSSLGGLSTINSPGGTAFNLKFDIGSVANGMDLRPISVTGSYGYQDCNNRYRTCTYVPGSLFSVSARTSDIAPTSLGEREIEALTAVPEPTMWAMMILGVGLIGAFARRRRFSSSYA